MPEEPAKEKEELLKGLGEVERKAKEVAANAKEVLQNAQLISDTAPPLRTLYDSIPVSGMSQEEWARQNRNVKSWLGAAQSMPPTFTDIRSFAALSQAVANTSVSGIMTTYVLRLPPSPPPSTAAPPAYPPPIQQATEMLAAVVEKYPSMDAARAEMKRLGLDSRGRGSKSALQLLEDARTSLDAPVLDEGAVGRALILLREAINASVSELIQRRVPQEDAKSWKAKMASLGRHCGRGHLDAAHFDNLGFQAENLIDQLSGGKQKGLTRPDTQMLFVRALLFLASFLGSIDEKKLRPGSGTIHRAACRSVDSIALRPHVGLTGGDQGPDSGVLEVVGRRRWREKRDAAHFPIRILMK